MTPQDSSYLQNLSLNLKKASDLIGRYVTETDSSARTVIVEQVAEARMFITGSKVIQSVTGEEVTDEELGGLTVHAEKSGNVHLAAANDEEAIRLIRELLSYLPANNSEDAPVAQSNDPIDRSTAEIGDIIPAEANKPNINTTRTLKNCGSTFKT